MAKSVKLLEFNFIFFGILNVLYIFVRCEERFKEPQGLKIIEKKKK